ncbi:MAG: SCP2 sterol-binding domain-containing protein [Ilumatobacteraceae bacterium]
MTIRYLSAEWINAVSDSVEASSSLQSLGRKHVFGLTQVVSATPFGEVRYHLQSGDGAVVFAAGDAFPENVRFMQSYETATAVATGRLNSQEAFINGHIRFSGDHQCLIDAQNIFALLDDVFTSVRSKTEYS